MSNNNHFKLPSQGAKIIKFKKPNNFSYLNFIHELKELTESLQRNVDHDYKLLSILYTAMNKYNNINGEICKSCFDAFNTITNFPKDLDLNIKKTRINLIIVEVVRTIDREIKKLEAEKTNNTIHLGRDDR